MPDRNDGVIVQDSDFHGSGSVVIGKDVHVRLGSAMAQMQGGNPEELRKLVAALMKEVEQHGADLDSPRAAGEQVEAIAEELAKPSPEPSRLLRMIDTLKAMTTGVASIAGAVDAVRLLVTHLH